MNTANPLASAAPLLWTQSKPMSRLYQLKSGDTLVGNLRFEKASGSRASAEVASQRWTFKREGFFHPRVTVRVPDSDVNVAVFHPQWSSGGNLDSPTATNSAGVAPIFGAPTGPSFTPIIARRSSSAITKAS